MMAERYTDIYRRAREALESDAEALLERPLSCREKNLFRSCGTITMLESLGMVVYYSQTGDELAAKLAEMSMESRFVLAVRETIERLERQIGRPLSDTERQQVRELGNIEELWTLEERLQEVEPDKHDTTLRSILAQARKSS